MIRKVIVLLAILTLAGLLASAQQSASKFDVFGGYSYLNGSTSGLGDRFSLNGWNAQGTYNFTHWLGATADFGGYYGSPFSVSAHDYSYLFGPTVSLRTPHFTPYFHTLFGADTFNVSALGGSISDTSFAMAVGGGVDIPVKGRLSIRAGQMDWLRSSHYNTSQNNFRVSTGVVFRFGE
ncbi:MAG: outer membrane beta-barrel protein [Candidatus Korobacteraceae bacterium]